MKRDWNICKNCHFCFTYHQVDWENPKLNTHDEVFCYLCTSPAVPFDENVERAWNELEAAGGDLCEYPMELMLNEWSNQEKTEDLPEVPQVQ